MADTTIKTNRRILNILLEIKNRAIDVEIKLLAEKKNNKAKKLGTGIDRLEDIIRKLRSRILDDWLSKVPALREDLSKMNGDVQMAIDDIKDDIGLAKKVVKLIGYIDDIVNIAGKVVV